MDGNKNIKQGKKFMTKPNIEGNNSQAELIRQYLPENLWLENFFNKEDGYGHAYTRFPFMKMEEFRSLERQARKGNKGLWSDLKK